MSLDCYPFGERNTIALDEQPMSIDVAYEKDLIICVVDNCQAVAVYDALAENDQLVNKFRLGDNIVIDQVIYNKPGQYIACVAHKNGSMSLRVIFNWLDPGKKPNIEILDNMKLNDQDDELQVDNAKINSVGACERTGNVVICYGDFVRIFKYSEREPPVEEQEPGAALGGGPNDVGNDDEHESRGFSDSLFSHAETIRDKFNTSTEDLTNDLANLQMELMNDQHQQPDVKSGGHFAHIITVKLSICASKVNLLENYLSLMAVDHVQVLKLELLTIQLQASETLDSDQNPDVVQSNDQMPIGHASPMSRNKSSTSVVTSEVGSNCGDTTTTTTTSSSMISDNSNSTTTNFSALTSGNVSKVEPTNHQPTEHSFLDNSDMSIITMNNSQLLGPNNPNQAQADLASFVSLIPDDCITWNLNTKKLVKLPTLMHNTSNSLSSFHICHPSELMGPASESIACRVTASIYSQDFCQNQLEPVVMLCRQFDADKGPVKSIHLQGVHLGQAHLSSDEQRSSKHKQSSKRLSVGSESKHPASNTTDARGHSGPASHSSPRDYNSSGCCNPLKSRDHENLASINCYVATLTCCYLYSLHGKKVQRIQVITNPDLCLDLRSDFLNLYILTPLGLQICSTSICDSAFRYDWSSSADLNLSFVAHCNRIRCLTTRHCAVFISSERRPSSESGSGPSSNGAPRRRLPPSRDCTSQIEVLRKPGPHELARRIVHTIKRCQSISVRSNLLTYLHANIQLYLLELDNKSANADEHGRTIELLREVAIMLSKELLRKKQTNVITNSKIDRAVKHLLDISHCDLAELMRRHLESDAKLVKRRRSLRLDSSELHGHAESVDGMKFSDLAEKEELSASGSVAGQSMQSDTDVSLAMVDELESDVDEPRNFDFELIKIYIKHSKFNHSILAYLRSVASQLEVCKKILTYMLEFNPRLLIRCAQRFIDINKDEKLQTCEGSVCISLLTDRLKQLSEFDSTGINRATVLFTAAILYNAQGDQESCLNSLSQIKPQNHLAITMCSNHEAISASLARVVQQNYPEVYSLFVAQVARRDQAASNRFSDLLRQKNQSKSRESLAMSNKNESDSSSAGSSDDEDEQLEKRLRLVADIPPGELADLLSSTLNDSYDDQDDEDRDAIRAYMKASINLLESQFILTRLCENSPH